MKWLLILAGLWLAPAVAHADPCEGRLPDRAGATFSGLVRHIRDGDSLCVGSSTNPSTWIEVGLSDFDAPELQSPTGRTDSKRLSGLLCERVLTCMGVHGRNGRVSSMIG
ncbi:nuclease [Brevundimonas sp. LM2]|uniref:nuclease n=1 Tax=Brevundimonas sp. LM2 TaxID=1938605 RepID=UPI00209BACC8|nr:nuclease [Brevundimonas sp. LM2]